MASQANILIVEDDAVGRRNLARILKKEGYGITCAATCGQALSALSKQRFDVVFSDLMLEEDGSGIDVLDAARRAGPDTEVIIITGYASVESAIKAMHKGAFHYLQKPFRAEEVRLLAERALEKTRLHNHVKQLEDEIRTAENRPVIVGKSEKIQSILRLIEQVGPTDANVLITGESGSGKELVASALHSKSQRARNRFLAINCASFTDELLANELFGHEKDAYTGATCARAGLLESADGGTIFFDEVADMPLPMQAKLLRVIQERELIRVGGTQPIPLSVRMIAATNKDLKNATAKGSFREDLYYRLNVIPIHMPALAERKEDIPLLAAHLLNRMLKFMNKSITGFTDEALKLLVGYEYPGNVRELENILERAAALCSGDVIGVQDLPPDLKDVAIFRYDNQAGRMKSMEELEREYILWVMNRVGHNKTHAANILGIDRASLYRKLKKYELDES
jgi:DNA-binding NtrC family response regulator